MEKIILLFLFASMILMNIFILAEYVFAHPQDEPKWQDNYTSVASGSQYLPGRNYGFEINWTDIDFDLDNVTFETNLTTGSALENLTKADTSEYTAFENNSDGIWWVNFTQEQFAGVGNYLFRWYANDTTLLENSSHQWKYEIAENASADIDLYIDGSRSDKSVEQYQNVNFTLVLNIPTSGQVELYTNFSEGSYKLWDSGSYPPQFENITNMTMLGNWTWIANYTNSNYTTATESWNVVVTERTEEFNITIYNSTNAISGSSIRIYNSTNDLIASGSGEISVTLIQYENYTLELTEDVSGKNLTTQVVDLNITESFNLTAQTVKDYSEGLPSGYNKITSVFALNDTELDYSYATVYIPVESFTITDIFHCKDAWNFTEGSCDTTSDWEVNDTGDYNAGSNSSHIFFNVTSFDGYGGGGSVYLEVELILPPGDTLVEQLEMFDVNATVFCRGGACSNVFGTVRYNLSSPYPDTAVNITYADEPLFVNETSPAALKGCPTNTLDENEFCNVTWLINATGALDSGWEFGVLFNSSDTGIDDNNTDNVTLTIVPCIEEMTIQYNNISFGTLLPNTTSSALGNADDFYNVTNSGTCTSNIWVKSTNLLRKTTSEVFIRYSNITFNNATNDYGSSFRMSDSFSQGNSTYKKNIDGSTNATGYYFIYAPIIYAGDYEGNITFCLNSSLTGTVC